MRVLIFHGYLLRGTGSNVYNANLAAALVELGHEVHLVCQERHARDLDFVGAVGDWDGGELVVRRVGQTRCTVYRPDIGGLLPVYVRDRYEGLEARLFSELTDRELEDYLLANVRAVAEVAGRSRPDVALANHLVMGPVILARALAETAVPYAVKIHGSALEYAVKPNPHLVPYAREGLAWARCVLVGSRHVAESLWATLADSALPARTRLGPPGVDLARFGPRDRSDGLARLGALAERMGQLEERHGRTDAEASAFSRHPATAAQALRQLVGGVEAGPLVGFVGKLIVSKGIDLLLAAWPLVLEAVPSARLVVIGFGAYRPGVERWIDALSSGDQRALYRLASSGHAEEGGPSSRLEYVLSFFDRLDRGGRVGSYLAAARLVRERVILTGRLEHDELVDVLPLCEALVVPSTFPESFGMVAVEAAACGVLPISAAHSGLVEVSRALTPGLPEPVRELVSVPLGPEIVDAIADRVVRWLHAPPGLRQQARAALVQTAAARYSWRGVARAVIAAARGELELLDVPGASSPVQRNTGVHAQVGELRAPGDVRGGPIRGAGDGYLGG